LGTILKGEAGKEVNPTLLRGHVPDFSKPNPALPPRPAPKLAAKPAPEPAPAPAPRTSIPRWYWLAADLLLVAFALVLQRQSPGKLTSGLAVGAVVLGGALAVWAVRPASNR
jgi:hypothetical protein